MFSIVLMTALAQPAPGGAQPAQVVARIDKGNLTITFVTDFPSGGYGSGPGTVVPVSGKAPVKVKVTSVVVTTAELPAKEVAAYSTDGKAISAETLANLLAKERTVLIALDGKKIDPFQLQLYKEGTIVLVPPANTLNLSGGFGGQYSPPPFVTPDGPKFPRDPKPDDPRQ